MPLKGKNQFELSDFSVDIYEQDDSYRVRVDCFADDSINPPFNVGAVTFVSKLRALNYATLYHELSMTISELINNIINSDIQRPEPCECNSREWFDKHPYDRQEYWRTNSGRIYPKDHTLHCPKNHVIPRRNDV